MMCNCKLYKTFNFSCKAGKKEKIGSWKRKRRCQKFDLEFLILFFFQKLLEMCLKGKMWFEWLCWFNCCCFFIQFKLCLQSKQFLIENLLWIFYWFNYWLFQSRQQIGICLSGQTVTLWNLTSIISIEKWFNWEKTPTKNRILTKWKLWHRLSHAWIHSRLRP